MTERVWLTGALPAVATDAWAVLTTGSGAVTAARRILALPEDLTDPAPILDALLADGIGRTPAFAVIGMTGGRLLAFLRGPFALRAEHVDGLVDRVDGGGVRTWREVGLGGVRRAWCLQSPSITRTDAAPQATPAAVGPATASGIALRAVPAVRITPAAPVATRPAVRGPRPPRMIELPGGARVPIEGDLLIGRGPRSGRLDGGRLPVLVPLIGAPRELSRRHVRVWRQGDGVRIQDLDTAGGTTLTDRAGVVRRLRPSEPAPVLAGESAELPGGIRIRFLGDA